VPFIGSWWLADAAAAGRLSIPFVLKPKRRGRGDAWPPLDEGKGCGIRGASIQLLPGVGGRPSTTNGMVVRRTGSGTVRCFMRTTTGNWAEWAKRASCKLGRLQR
jgi:hypothetical protein